MGDLAKYIAEVVEFVVAGVLVFFSLLLLGYVVVRPDLAALPDELPFLSSLGGLLPVVGVALIYALGIIAEGMSRIMFEHGLGELTHEKLKHHRSARRAEPDAAHKAEVAHYEGVREEWRMYVLAHSASLNAQVDGQLKRLRIERAAALSGGISSLALLIDVAVTAAQHDMRLHGVLLVVLVLASCVAARLWLVGEQVPSAAMSAQPEVREHSRRTVDEWWRHEVRLKPARAVALAGVVLSVALLCGIVVGAGSEVMGLRAALLVAALVVTCCAVALSLVRLKRYLGSIVRCYEALREKPPVANASDAAGAPTS